MRTVANVIAAARVLMRRPSVLKMPDEDLRFLLHQQLEILNTMAVEANGDFYTHEAEVEFTYSSAHRGFTYNITGLTDSNFYVYPVALYYQDSTADPDTESWYRVNVVKYAQFPSQSGSGSVVAAFTGNEFDGAGSRVMRINKTDEWVQDQRFRIGYRVMPATPLGYTDNIPFPNEFITVLEYMLADAALLLVEDNSPDWRGFVQTYGPKLTSQAMLRRVEFIEWVNRDTENVYVTENPYHYRLNNPLRRSARRLKVD